MESGIAENATTSLQAEPTPQPQSWAKSRHVQPEDSSAHQPFLRNSTASDPAREWRLQWQAPQGNPVPDERNPRLNRSSPLKKQLRNKQKNSRPRPTTNSSRSSGEILLTIELPSKKIADTIFRSLLPETKQPAGHRSQTRIRCKGQVLELKIVADDLVALRAASNTFLRFVSVALKTLNVVSPFYRAGSPTLISKASITF